MTRVKYEYDGSTGTETTANFSVGEETAQDSVDTANQTSATSALKQASVPLGTAEVRSIMEVI